MTDHAARAREILHGDDWWEESDGSYGAYGLFVKEDVLVAHITQALRDAERAGLRRAAEVVRRATTNSFADVRDDLVAKLHQLADEDA